MVEERVPTTEHWTCACLSVVIPLHGTKQGRNVSTKVAIL